MNKKIVPLIFLCLFLVSCNSVSKTNKADSIEKKTSQSEKQTSQVEKQTTKQENLNKQEDKKDNVVTNNPDINVFWSEFRKMALSKDIKTLKSFVQFPLETRGPMDSDSIIKFNENEFQEVITAYFNGESGMELQETNLDYIKKHEKLDSKVLTMFSKDEARIGNMKLKLINNNWKVTFLYLDENSYKKLGKDDN